HEGGITFGRAIGEPILDLNVATLAVSQIAQAVAKRCKIARSGGYRERGHDADHRHRRLLRARRERPSRGRAADQRDELAPSHVGHGLPPFRSVRALRGWKIIPPLCPDMIFGSTRVTAGASGFFF